MPAKNSACGSDQLAQLRAMRAHGTLASQYTLEAERRSMRVKAPAVAMTTPRIPPSRTSRLVPRPTQYSGTDAGSARRKPASSSTSRGLKNACAAPPACQEQCVAIGSFQRTRAE